jgi:N-acetylmuramoyl-L-alanine amidase
MKRICIDPGHPSYFKGTKKINWGCEENGIKEVELNLSLASLLMIFLERSGFEVILTRKDNFFVVSNKERARKAKEFNADLFLRIHLDSERRGDKAVKGTRTVYPPSFAKNISQKSWEIAIHIHRSVILKTGLVDRGVCDERVCTFSSKEGMLEGSHLADEFNISSVLLEVVYISNREDAKWILNKENQSLYVEAVAEGLLNYLSLEKNKL